MTAAQLATVHTSHPAPANDNHPTAARSRFRVLAPLPDTTWAPLGTPVALLDRTDDQCAWPVGPASARTCCGQPVTHKSYCAAHSTKAYRKAPGEADFQDTIRQGRVRGGIDAEISVDEAMAFLLGRKRGRV